MSSYLPQNVKHNVSVYILLHWNLDLSFYKFVIPQRYQAYINLLMKEHNKYKILLKTCFTGLTEIDKKYNICVKLSAVQVSCVSAYD